MMERKTLFLLGASVQRMLLSDLPLKLAVFCCQIFRIQQQYLVITEGYTACCTSIIQTK